MVSSKELIEIDSKYGAHNYHPLDVVISKAKGIWVWDVEGKKYLDCLSAYSAVNQGHLHPKIVQALKDQADKLTLTSRAFRNDRMGPFLKHLCDVAEMEAALPMNTGAEAVETGLKIARRWGYEVKGIVDNQAEIIVAEENFHGRTITIVSFSTDPDACTHFGPKTPGFKVIPYDNPKALEQTITPNTAAFLVEPIQGEAGVNIPSPGYLKKVREICTNHNILLILDEIQTGLGRTGKMFAYQHEGIKPDMLLVGKALGGGVFPISAALSSWDIMKVITPGSHGSTFGGNPLACAVGDAALDVLVDEKLAERATELGAHFKDGLHNIKAKTDRIKEVRGKGLLIAVEFKSEVGGARQFTQKLKEKGILAKETHTHTIRFAPPLIITKEDIDWALKIIEEVFTET
ncbi:MAG: ornithine--oxo-acid transaminase [Promethearchaeota archaeon]